MKENILYTRDINLTQQIVILDGLTGTGKTMFSPLISSFDRVQNARFEYMFEYLCISASNNKITSDASHSLLNLLADIKYYDGTISREVNFRPNDLSSIFKSSKSFKYIKQLWMKDGHNVEERIKKEKPILFLVTHQLLSCLEPAFKAFNKRLKIVEMVRHPLYLLDHWATYIEMHGKNARDFTIWQDYKGESLPWFANGFDELYQNSSPYDKVIYSIKSLMKSVFEKVRLDKQNNSILFIPFEQFVLEPAPFINRLEVFLKTKPTSATEKVLKKQRVPRPTINAGPQKNIYKRYGLKKLDKNTTPHQDYHNLLESAKQKSSPEAFEIVLELSKQYEDNFGLWF